MEWPGQESFSAIELREWFVDGKAAGNTRSYGNFTFATIYRAGHLVSKACSRGRHVLPVWGSRQSKDLSQIIDTTR